MAREDAASEAERYLRRAGRLLKNNNWERDAQADYFLSCAQVLAQLELAAAIRGEAPNAGLGRSTASEGDPEE
jgi:hypothetical protein